MSNELIIHPRLLQQNIAGARAQAVFAEALARVRPFRAQVLHAATGLLDWDHRLPSRALTLRLHVCYDAAAAARLQHALQRRSEEIAARDVYPEFDVPDFAGLPADESYDVELSAEMSFETMRLVSPWRREIGEDDAAAAVEVVRASTQYVQAKASDLGQLAMGDLEAVAWTPPCESGLAAWALDVWWLTSFDGRIGRGWSFLVDPSALPPVVVSAREFSVRAG